MKKAVFASAMVLALMAGVPVLAVEQNRPATTSAKPTTNSENVKSGDANLTTAQKARVLEARKKTLKSLVDNQKELIGRLVSRFDSIINLIQSRHDKMAAAGINVSTIDPLIATAKTQKADAIKLLATVKLKAEAMQTAEDPKAAAQDFLKASRELRTKLDALQKTLREISAKMKALEKDPKRTEIKPNKSNE